MPQRSGNPQQIYSIGGEGLVLITPKGGDPNADAVDYHNVSWSGNMTIQEQDVTNTSDFNEATNLMNPRSLITQQRIEGTIMFHHNADPEFDVLKNIPLGTYQIFRLFITRGIVAGTGITGVNRCYFDVPEGQVGPIAIEGGDVNAVRGLNYTFKSNGVFNYVNEPAVAAA